MINYTKIDIIKYIENILSSLSQSEINFYTNIIIELTNKNEPFEDKELYAIFDKLDTEEKSSIKFYHVINLLCILRTELNSFYIDKILQKLSQEKSEEISRDDFVIKMKIGKTTLEKDDHSELEEIFQILDTDHDGVIGPQDIYTVMNTLGESVFDENMCKNLVNLFIHNNNTHSKGKHSNSNATLNDKGITKETFIELFKHEI